MKASIMKTSMLATVIFLISNLVIHHSFAESTTREIHIDLSTSLKEEPSEIVLSWESKTLDIDHYNVYSSANSEFKPGDDGTLLAEVSSATDFIDSDGIYANETKYYYVTAVDEYGNELALSNIESIIADDYTDYGYEDIRWSRSNPNAGAIWLNQEFISDYVIIHYTINGQQYDEHMKHTSNGSWMMEFDDLRAVEDFSFTYQILGFQYDSK
ncbi:hypothetical protein [Cytobacillus sp. IB215665]|uniref:hypothetical protein n=1 Tax=Cytobacillus sp. IB215665 TaxID=3097357 RepID=UPI002A12CBC5|nr:hypothetical protein [Cytobacillus sp. IB215665]MDX8365546.1 hypothetical protein [Cytobacillus sp. IB215665]